ncbi:hypothetical protein CVT24_009736 [Panaeolus cyanescens]|uniref:Telomere replication protein EST3 n=1 Tax=Panaeolus cyanescens TaxID=181874 RepID=A0A409Y9Y9_9AGAR|nr:hypothetical protein CVT24_009736 [Panaeolus cyanescens]
MSESLSQWICQYLVEIAQKYGAQVSSFPNFSKKKKVQITELLWVDDNDTNSSAWVHVSDKVNTIPVKFSSDAVKAFNASSSRSLYFFAHFSPKKLKLVSYSKLPENKGSVVQMKDFKVILSRIPNLGSSVQGGMTKDAFLALECHSVSYMGAAGSSIFGSPRQVNSDPQVKEWLHGLREGGGAGNVLRDRAKARHIDQPGALEEDIGSIQEEESTTNSMVGIAKSWKDIINNMDYRWIPKEMSKMIYGCEEPIEMEKERSTSPKWDMEKLASDMELDGLDSPNISLSHAGPILPRVLAPNSDTSGTQTQTQTLNGIESQVQVLAAGDKSLPWMDLKTVIRILKDASV